MTHSHTRLSGLMTLTLLDRNGTPLACIKRHNSVMPAGQALLMNLLSGASTKPEFRPLLGADGFKPDVAKPEDQAAAMALENIELLNMKLAKSTLSISYRGDAPRPAKIIGGGLLVDSQTAAGAKATSLYNFAPTDNTIEVVKGMPVLLNFSLSVGN